MSNIDKILKEALQGFEAPFDPTMWDKVSGQLSPMEDAFRDAVSEHEAPYNPKAWSAIKNQIGSSWSLTQWIAGSAAAIALVATAIVFWPTTDESKMDSATQPVQNDTNGLVVLTDNSSANKGESTTENLTELTTDENAAVTAPTHHTTTVDHLPNHNDSHFPSSTDSNDHNLTNVPNDEHLTPTELTTNPDEDQPVEPASNLVYMKRAADFSISNSSVCAGTTLLFNPKVSKFDTNHTWDFGDGTFSIDPVAKHSYTTAGTFEVTHSLIQNGTNKVIAVQKETVIINALPTVDFTWDKNNEVIPTINFINPTDESYSSIWKVDGQVVSDQNEFEHTFREKGNHQVELTATNENGCSNTSVSEIEIKSNYNLFAPSAFTPNGDGTNDEFMPVALTIQNNQFTMVIYDEPGNLVFQTSNSNYQWDGRDMNTRTEAPAGAYIWMVTLKNGNGTMETYTGQIFLAR